MKVVAAQEMSRVEREAFAAGASDLAFMLEAGRGIAEYTHAFVKERQLDWPVTLLCGKGNNGGDAYVAGSHLKELGHPVRALQLCPIDQCSPLCREQFDRFANLGGEVIHVHSAEDLQFFDSGVVLDGIFGTGFHGEVTGLFAQAIEAANGTTLPLLAIDIPSGVNGNTGSVSHAAIRAAATIYLGLPKAGFFLGDAWNRVGMLHRVDFGLDPKLVDSASATYNLLTADEAAELFPPLVRNRHKYQAGYVVGVAGSAALPGAAILASSSALRSGAGMMRLFHPADIEVHKLGAPPEVIGEPYSIEGVQAALERAGALFLGPGIGVDAVEMVREVLSIIDKPCVIDADALTILGMHSEWTVPTGAILTPHVGEMRRLLGDEGLEGAHLIEATQEYVDGRQVTVILKGGPTFVFSPSAAPTVIERGDPGMATAGAGDVLTGVIAALLSQGLNVRDAALLGPYLHGIAGEKAAADLTSYAMVATDLCEHLPDAFSEYH